VGASLFGNVDTAATVWDTQPEIWLRCEFELDGTPTEPLFFDTYCGFKADFFLNGVHAAEARDLDEAFRTIRCSSQAAESLKPGRNVLAIRCFNRGGQAAIDAGLFADQGPQRWIDLLSDALSAEPDNPYLLQARMQAYGEQGEAELVAADSAILLPLLKKRVEEELEDPNTIWPKFAGLLADVLINKHSVEATSDWADTTRVKLLEIPEQWERLAAAYFLSDDKQGLEHLLEYQPRANAGIANLHLLNEDWDQAIDIYNRLITRDTPNASLLVSRAAAYAALAKWEDAEADWQQTMELQPSLLSEAFDRFRLEGRWQASAKLGMMLIQREPNRDRLYLCTGPVLVLAGDEVAYRRFCQQVVTHLGATDSVRYTEAACKTALLMPGYVDLSKLPVQALGEPLDKISELEPGRWGWTWATRALVAYRNGDLDEAERCLQQGASSDPLPETQPLLDAITALVNHARGDIDAARKTIHRVMQTVDEEIPDANVDVQHHWLISKILAQEAQSLLDNENSSETASDSDNKQPSSQR
jgi:tetratricopeptide (TPR) repeat protein